MTVPAVHGIMAEFETPAGLVTAIHAAREAGYTRMDAYTPCPIEEVIHALGHKRTILPAIVLGCGIAGVLTGFGLQYYCSAIAYPLNIGGRPLNSWPSFVIIMFELAILFAAFGAVFGMLALNRLPMPYHPVFNVEGFERASRDRYFLCIESADALFDADKTTDFLRQQKACEVTHVAL